MTSYNNKTTPKMPTKANSTKRKVTRINYKVKSVDEYLMYAGSDPTQDIIFTLSIDAIKYGIIEQKDVVDILYLAGEKNNSFFSIPKNNWKIVLKSAIKFYSKNNQYEKCIDCQQLISTLQ